MKLISITRFSDGISGLIWSGSAASVTADDRTKMATINCCMASVIQDSVSVSSCEFQTLTELDMDGLAGKAFGFSFDFL